MYVQRLKAESDKTPLLCSQVQKNDDFVHDLLPTEPGLLHTPTWSLRWRCPEGRAHQNIHRGDTD